MSLLSLQNRQRARAIDLRLLRKITTFSLKEIFLQPQFELGIHLVGAKEMAEVNEQYLQHSGSTDVITFDHNQIGAESRAAKAPPFPQGLHGEIFISIDDAVKQAKEFRTTWQSELVRYVVHGILHLQGHDDLEPVSRKKMKRAETQTLKRLAKEFSLQQLERKL